MNYSKEEKDRIVKIFFDLQKTEVSVSVRSYSALVGVKYYTFRDWYRDYKANEEYHNISTEEYLEKRREEAEKTNELSSDDGFSFIKLTRGGSEECF